MDYLIVIEDRVNGNLSKVLVNATSKADAMRRASRDERFIVRDNPNVITLNDARNKPYGEE